MKKRWVRLCVAMVTCTVLVSYWFCGFTLADDSYFRHAIAKMIKDSVVPEDGYGFTLDYLSGPYRTPQTDVKKIVFYTKGFDAYLRERSENFGGNPGYIEEKLTIFNGWDVDRVSKLEIPGEPTRVFRESNVVSGNMGERCGVGDYSVPRGEEEQKYCPEYMQPWQFLVNPCYRLFTDSISPEKLLHITSDKLTSLPNEDGNHVFSIKDIDEHSENQPEFIFHFSPKDDDKLVKFERRHQGTGRNATYVDGWQKHANGSLIATSICYEYEFIDTVPRGERSFRKEYKISNVKIGKIDSRLFDVSKQPEFRQEWDVKVDYSKIPGDPDRVKNRDANYYLQKADHARRWKVFLAVNAVGISLILFLLYQKRIRNRA